MSKNTEIAFLLERLSRILHTDAHTHGLKPTQWEVLRYLSRANKFSKTPKAVTAYLGMTKGTVSQTIMSMAQKGLVIKSGGEDKRSVVLSLTSSGRALLKDDPLNTYMEANENLPEPEIAVLKRSLKALLSIVLNNRDGHAFGICHTCRYFKAKSPHHCRLMDIPLSLEDSAKICVDYAAAPVTSHA